MRPRWGFQSKRRPLRIFGGAGKPSEKQVDVTLIIDHAQNYAAPEVEHHSIQIHIVLDLFNPTETHDDVMLIGNVFRNWSGVGG
jgi:hypothetical protein